jgi:hypothetical protein
MSAAWSAVTRVGRLTRSEWRIETMDQGGPKSGPKLFPQENDSWLTNINPAFKHVLNVRKHVNSAPMPV